MRSRRFAWLRRGNAKVLEPCVVRFLLRAVIEDNAHRFPLVKVPKRGHARGAFELGLDRFSVELAETIFRLGIVWSHPGSVSKDEVSDG